MKLLTFFHTLEMDFVLLFYGDFIVDDIVNCFGVTGILVVCQVVVLLI